MLVHSFLLLFFYSLLISLNDPISSESLEKHSSFLHLTFTSKRKPIVPKNHIPIFVSGKLALDGNMKLKRAKSPKDFLLMIVPSFSNWNRANSSQFTTQFSGSLQKILKDNPNLKGLVLDAELGPQQTKKNYSELVCKIFKLTKVNKLQFYLALFLPNHPDRKDYYDWKILFGCSDYWVLMLYDEHSPRTQEGPVATSHWIQMNLNSLEDIISNTGELYSHSSKVNNKLLIANIRKKIILGLPLYGYGKQKNGRFGKVHPIKNWEDNSAFQNSKADYITIQTQTENIFLPTSHFLSRWETLANDLGFAGVAYWREEFLN